MVARGRTLKKKLRSCTDLQRRRRGAHRCWPPGLSPLRVNFSHLDGSALALSRSNVSFFSHSCAAGVSTGTDLRSPAVGAQRLAECTAGCEFGCFCTQPALQLTLLIFHPGDLRAADFAVHLISHVLISLRRVSLGTGLRSADPGSWKAGIPLKQLAPPSAGLAGYEFLTFFLHRNALCSAHCRTVCRPRISYFSVF